MSSFQAWVIEKTADGKGQTVAFKPFERAALMDGDVTVRVSHSTINYKDGLALTGKAPIARRFPMIPGIDLAGMVESSSSPAYAAGDRVILNGWGAGETHLGTLAEIVRVPADWLLPQPAGFTPAEAAAIGTAGYTAMLCLMAIERHGLKPADGPAIVTGAAGGVGSVGVALLAHQGWQVLASTGRPEEEDYLRELGAAGIVARAELARTPRPLEKERWAAGIDTVGSLTLATVLAQTKAGGAIAACGNAGGMDLPASVAPFILRGVSLLGVNSVTVARQTRLLAWRRLADELDRKLLAGMTGTIPLEKALEAGRAIVEGKIRGRLVVEVAPDL
jgi:acrylyl-CoA reductase (NADPH)